MTNRNKAPDAAELSDTLDCTAAPHMLFFALDEARENNDLSRFNTCKQWLRGKGYIIEFVGGPA
jgi:hypothetical protein